MDRHIRIINPQKYAEAISKMACGETRFGEIKGEWFEMEAFTIRSPNEFKVPEKYPACCEYHTDIIKTSKEIFEKFPECCTAHKRMLSTKWFVKNQYRYIIEKLPNQLLYTSFIIEQKIENDDWYEDITDYIEYNMSSFGQFPLGFGPAIGLNHYLTGVRNEIEHLKDDNAPAWKKTRLIQFIDGLTVSSKREKIDFNQLETTYKNWLKAFPFQIIHFKNLKQHFEKQFPIINGSPTTNRYSGISKVKILTQSDFLNFLNTLTKKLLEEVDSTVLVKNGVITNLKAHSIELLNANHKIQQISIISEFSDGEKKYLDILRLWLANERSYFQDLAILISSQQENVIPSSIQFPPLSDEIQFEDFVCELFNTEHPKSLYQKFGKRGNIQKGIDLLSIVSQIAIQCKKKELSRSRILNELKKDMEDDVSNALKLEVKIELLIFTSTFDDNTELIEHATRLKKLMNAPFDITYLGWQSLSDKLRRHSNLVTKYYGKSWGIADNG